MQLKKIYALHKAGSSSCKVTLRAAVPVSYIMRFSWPLMISGPHPTVAAAACRSKLLSTLLLLLPLTLLLEALLLFRWLSSPLPLPTAPNPLSATNKPPTDCNVCTRVAGDHRAGLLLGGCASILSAVVAPSSFLEDADVTSASAAARLISMPHFSAGSASSCG